LALSVLTESPADEVTRRGHSLPPGCAQTCECLFPRPAFKDKWHAALDDIEFSQPQPAPYGPAERTAAIDRCAQIVDETIQTLECFWGFLLDARALPPDQVDGGKWLDLENGVIDAEYKLDSAIQSSDFFEAAIETATGRRAYFWCLKSDIIGNDKLDVAFVQSEINAFREDYPGQTNELQALLNARLEVNYRASYVWAISGR
jgi:hypothetical protein